MSEPKAFYSYLENESKLNKLSDEQAGRLYKSLYAYCRTGEKPDFSDDPLLDYAFDDFIIDIDRDRRKYEQTCRRRAEAGRKGGQANASDKQANQANASDKQANQANASDKQANQANASNKQANQANASNKQAKQSKSSETETETEVETEVTKVTKEKSIKEKFGEFQNVLLTAEECHKLSAQFPNDWRDRIESLSQYLAQTGKRYKSHYATILAWARKDKPPDNKRGSMYTAEGASFDAGKWRGHTPEGCG